MSEPLGGLVVRGPSAGDAPDPGKSSGNLLTDEEQEVLQRPPPRPLEQFHATRSGGTW